MKSSTHEWLTAYTRLCPGLRLRGLPCVHPAPATAASAKCASQFLTQAPHFPGPFPAQILPKQKGSKVLADAMEALLGAFVATGGHSAALAFLQVRSGAEVGLGGRCGAAIVVHPERALAGACATVPCRLGLSPNYQPPPHACLPPPYPWQHLGLLKDWKPASAAACIQAPSGSAAAAAEGGGAAGGGEQGGRGVEVESDVAAIEAVLG